MTSHQPALWIYDSLGRSWPVYPVQIPALTPWTLLQPGPLHSSPNPSPVYHQAVETVPWPLSATLPADLLSAGNPSTYVESCHPIETHHNENHPWSSSAEITRAPCPPACTTCFQNAQSYNFSRTLELQSPQNYHIPPPFVPNTDLSVVVDQANMADAVAMLAGGQENVDHTTRSTETEEESSGYGTGYRVESLSVSTQSVAESSGRSSSDDAVPCRLGQFGADPVHRFAYQKSPSGSLWVGDCIAGVSIFVANDFRTCALTFPFGRILLTCSTRIHVAVKTNTDRKRFAKLEGHGIYFSSRDSSTERPGVVYLLDASGVKTSHQKLNALRDVSPRLMFRRDVRRPTLTVGDLSAAAAGEDYSVDLRSDSFRLCDAEHHLRVSLEQRSNVTVLEMPSLFVSSNARDGVVTRMFIKRTLPNNVVQKVNLDQNVFRVHHDRQVASIKSNDQLDLSV